MLLASITLLPLFISTQERQASGTVEDRTNADSLDDEDLVGLGNVRCGLEERDIQRMASDAIVNNMADMSQCHYSGVVGKALVDRAMLLDPYVLVAMGHSVRH